MPTQLLTHLQWWSKFLVHLLHLTQCLLVEFTGDLQKLQNFSCFSSISRTLLSNFYDLSFSLWKISTISSDGSDFESLYPSKRTISWRTVKIIMIGIRVSNSKHGIVVQ